MLREVIKYGAPRLRQPAVPVPEGDGIEALARTLIETMQAHKGIGLAAPQVGMLVRAFAVEVPGGAGPLVFINPHIDISGEETSFCEGCLSIPNVFADIVRPAQVRVQALGYDGKSFLPMDFSASGLLARVIQHEADHLDGVLFIDRLAEASRLKLAHLLA